MGMVLSYELGFLLSIITVVIKVRSFLLGDIVAYQAEHGAILLSASGVIAFAVALLCAQAKLGFVPFDLAEADTEIAEGALIEYSGAALGFFKLTQAVLLAVLPAFLVLVFWGGIDPTAWGVLAFVGKVALIVVLFVLIKNTNPRVRIDQALRFLWGPVTLVALVALVLAQLGL